YVWAPLSVTVHSEVEPDLSPLEEIVYDSDEDLTEDEYVQLMQDIENFERKQETGDGKEIEEIEAYEEKREKKKVTLELEEETEILVTNSESGDIIFRGNITRGDCFGKLLPLSPKINIGIKGFPIEIDGKPHYHPDDAVGI
ncbi:MAG: hypothetical protein ACLFQB_16230, partial [Chitinispirillaceae bacterium]